MSVKISGWSSEHTNRMCYGDTWGSSSPGIFLLAAPVGRFIMWGLRVENQQRRGSSQCGRVGGSQLATRRQVCFYMFSFLPFKKQGDLQVAYWGNQVHKAARRAADTCLKSNAIPRGWPLLTFITVNTLCLRLSCLAHPLATFMWSLGLINLSYLLEAHLDILRVDASTYKRADINNSKGYKYEYLVLTKSYLVREWHKYFILRKLSDSFLCTRNFQNYNRLTLYSSGSFLKFFYGEPVS